VSTWVHAWPVLHKISKSSLLHGCHGNNVGHPLYPWTADQTNALTYIMFGRSISLEQKSQLTINLDPGWEFPSLPSEEGTMGSPKKEESLTVELLTRFKKKRQKEKKFTVKDRKKTKKKEKKRESSQSKIRRKQREKENPRSKIRRK